MVHEANTMISLYYIALGSVASILLSLCAVSPKAKRFEPHQLAVLNHTSTSITLAWELGDEHNIHFQVWYWPSNSSLQVQMLSLAQNNVTLHNLIPGELYNIWLLGIQGNITTYYVTLLQTTGMVVHYTIM